MDALEQARAEIDAVDTQLAALFERRMAAVLQVAEYKRAHGLPILRCRPRDGSAGKGCGPHSVSRPAALL